MKRIHKASLDQTIGSSVYYWNEERQAELRDQLLRLKELEQLELQGQDEALFKAMEQVDKIREFLKNPGNILGSDLTKHGEIAENIEVNIRNARDLLEGRHASATFENVGRTAPEDFLVEGIKVQSKFINGLNNNLDHVLNHMGKYDSFGKDGSYYSIPKDHYEQIKMILNGQKPDELSERTARKILEKVREIERETGKPFDQVVKPSISNYAEVQQGTANQTINENGEKLSQRNEEIKDEIREKTGEKKEQAQQTSKPSWEDGMKVTLIGALIGGGISVIAGVYKKKKEEDKSICQFTSEDWQDIGIDFAKGGGRSGVSAASIYALTNYTKMGAPLAAAFTSAAFGVASLAMDYNNGLIDMGELITNGQMVCMECGLTTLGAVAGQLIIPIPIIGALVGSFAVGVLASFTKKYLAEDGSKVKQQLDRIFFDSLSKISREYGSIVDRIMVEYEKLGAITQMAFNFDSNATLRFDYSQKLAEAHGVEGSKIIKTVHDVDNFFLN